MPFRLLTIDRYIVRELLGTMGGVLAVVMSLMILEHLPRLLEITRFSGHRGYIITQTIGGLLPEYGGIGLLVGLYLSVALTVRKLALRRELDAIEASGIAPMRWMRLPLLLATLISVLTIANQGWLMPAGEVRLAEVGQRMEHGEFGYELQPGQFIDLGSGSTLQFQRVGAQNGEIRGLFLRTQGQTYIARRGLFSKLPSGATAIELRDGQVIQERDARVLDFASFQFRVDAVARGPAEESRENGLKQSHIGSLWAKGTIPGRAAVYGRFLWGALALLLPTLALVLGKPPRQQSGAVGILVGMILLVTGLKMTASLLGGYSSRPEVLTATILAVWISFVFALVKSDKVFSQGFMDVWASRAFQGSVTLSTELFHRIDLLFKIWRIRNT